LFPTIPTIPTKTHSSFSRAPGRSFPSPKIKPKSASKDRKSRLAALGLEFLADGVIHWARRKERPVWNSKHSSLTAATDTETEAQKGTSAFTNNRDEDHPLLNALLLVALLGLHLGGGLCGQGKRECPAVARLAKKVTLYN